MFFPQEPSLTIFLPELKECSKELLSLGIQHDLVCDIVNSVLHCYAQVSHVSSTVCEMYIIYGDFNFI